MFNFFAKRLLKRAGLSADDLRDLVERGTKELEETEEPMKALDQKGETIQSVFDTWQSDMSEALRQAKADAQQKKARQEEEANNSAALDDMLQKLRPGMHIREFDPITARFGDAYSPDALRKTDIWTGAEKGKCVIDYDANGILTRVHFFGATKDTLKLSTVKQLETVLKTCTGVVLAEDLEVHDKSPARAVEVGCPDPNFEVIAWFWCGRFHSTTYMTSSERLRMAKSIEAQRPPEAAKPEPFAHKTPEQIAADTEFAQCVLRMGRPKRRCDLPGSGGVDHQSDFSRRAPTDWRQLGRWASHPFLDHLPARHLSGNSAEGLPVRRGPVSLGRAQAKQSKQ